MRLALLGRRRVVHAAALALRVVYLVRVSGVGVGVGVGAGVGAGIGAGAGGGIGRGTVRVRVGSRLGVRGRHRHVVAVDADHRRPKALAHTRDHLGGGLGVRVRGSG